MIFSAGGPYGCFGSLEEVRFFEDIADAIPDASIEGYISRFDNGEHQAMSCKTEEGKLHLGYKWFMDENYYIDIFGDCSDPDSESIYDPIEKKYETLN